MRSEYRPLAQFELSLDHLRRIDCFQTLCDAELARILPYVKARQVKARSSFVISRDFAERVIFVLGGQLRVVAMSPRADRITLKTVRQGGIVGDVGAILGQSASSVERLVVDEASVILELSRTDFARLIHEMPLMSIALLRSATMHNQECERRLYELGTLGVRARLQAELLRLAQPSAEIDGQWVIMPAPTHEALGASIAAGREAVSRHLSQLSRKGIVRVKHRSIAIIDIARLCELEATTDGRRLGRAEEHRADYPALHANASYLEP
jgi:CRP-like cAMP-binding protein